MANSKISALTSATTPLAGTETLPIVQSGVTKQVAVSDLTAGRDVSTAALTATGLITATKGSTRGITIGDVTTNSNSVLRMLGTSAGYNFLIANNLNFGGLEITPSTATGGTTFTTPRFGLAGTGILTLSAYGAGAATFSAAGVISSVSDETWKIKDGVPVDADSMIKKLTPGYWYYNKEKQKIFGSQRELGFYAQNVHYAIGAEAAPHPEDGKPWGYHDRSVLAVAVLSLQKALVTIESLNDRINQLEENAKIKSLQLISSSA